MKKFLLSGVLRAPESGSGSAGGGGSGTGSTGVGVLAHFFNESNKGGNSIGGGNNNSSSGDGGGDRSGDDSEDYDNEDGDDDDAGAGDLDSGDSDVDDAGGQGGKGKGSVIERQLQKIEDANKRKAEARETKNRGKDGSKEGDQQEDSENQSKQEEKGKGGSQKPAKQWDGKSKLTDEELLSLDPVNSLGEKVGVKAKQGFDLLKKRLGELHQEVSTLRSGEGSRQLVNQELETIKTQLTEKDTIIAELREQIDNEMFESSPGFRDTYQKPVDDSISNLRMFFKSYTGDASREDQSQIRALFTKATGLASTGDRAGYLEVMDELSESYIRGGQVIKTEFARNAAEYYMAQKSLADAMVEKGDSRKKLVEAKTAERRSKDTIGLESDIDRFIKKFEADNHSLLNAIPQDQANRFRSIYNDGSKATKAALAQFAATGTLPSSLNDVIARGVAYEALNQKSTMVWNAFIDATNKHKIMEERLQQAEAKLAKYTREPGRSNSSPNGQSRQGSNNNNGSNRVGNRLAAAYEKVAGYNGDD